MSESDESVFWSEKEAGSLGSEDFQSNQCCGSKRIRLSPEFDDHQVSSSLPPLLVYVFFQFLPSIISFSISQVSVVSDLFCMAVWCFAC